MCNWCRNYADEYFQNLAGFQDQYQREILGTGAMLSLVDDEMTRDMVQYSEQVDVFEHDGRRYATYSLSFTKTVRYILIDLANVCRDESAVAASRDVARCVGQRLEAAQAQIRDCMLQSDSELGVAKLEILPPLLQTMTAPGLPSSDVWSGTEDSNGNSSPDVSSDEDDVHGNQEQTAGAERQHSTAADSSSTVGDDGIQCSSQHGSENKCSQQHQGNIAAASADAEPELEERPQPQRMVQEAPYRTIRVSSKSKSGF
jgi:hypothetical protein